MNPVHWYELFLAATFFGLFIAGMESLYSKRLREERQQWELGDSCLRKRASEYRKNFGIADVRTLRVDKSK